MPENLMPGDPLFNAAAGIVDASRELASSGMNRNASGNVSVRCTLSSGEPGFLITPSGVRPSDLAADTICPMDMAGTFAGKFGRPSSEWRFHRDIYLARPDVNAVVHTHSVFATVLACLHMEVPAFHYMIAVTGGNKIPCAPYALFGTQALSDAVLQTIGSGFACLLANHGMVAVGSGLDKAMAVAVETEALCEQYWRVLQAGSPRLLTDAQMKEVHEKFKDYFKK